MDRKLNSLNNINTNSRLNHGVTAADTTTVSSLVYLVIWTSKVQLLPKFLVLKTL